MLWFAIVSQNPPARVIISHSHLDNEFTERLVGDLSKAGADVWLDIVDVTRGDFIERIDNALASRDWLVVVLTPNALQSRWVRLEVNAAINRQMRGLMQGVIPFIAESFALADLPPTWGVLHSYDATHSYERALAGLLNALGLAQSPTQENRNTGNYVEITQQKSIELREAALHRLADLGFDRKRISGVDYILPILCQIQAGEFLMGTDRSRDRIGDEDEQPQHSVDLPAYSIGCFPVTCAEYDLFVEAGGRQPSNWADDRTLVTWETQRLLPDRPVVCVTYQDALDYADWLGVITGEGWRLPTEAEWEKAARWDSQQRIARNYPWGDVFNGALCNTSISGTPGPVEVGAFAKNISPYGVYDMAGNVWDWTTSMPAPYPYVRGDGRDYKYNTARSRVIRGGSWAVSPRNSRCAFREIVDPGFAHGAAGFRLVLDET